jgi:hypothetical protein
LRDLSVHIALKNHQTDSAETSDAAAKPKAAKKSQPAHSNSDRKKKSLPVRKLLELERASHPAATNDDDDDDDNGADDVIQCDAVGHSTEFSSVELERMSKSFQRFEIYDHLHT